MPNLSEGPSGRRNPEAAYGGADAVNDTPGAPAHGTEPEQQRTGTARARVSSGGGFGVVGWVIVLLVALVAVAYLAGMFR
jgi:hypothetical protein